MYIDKENIHPNVAHLIRQKRSIDEWSRTSRQQSRQQGDDWRKRVMCPSFRQKEIEDKLMKMLNSQKSVKECMRTTLSEQKMVNSFTSSNPNYTLQKYFQQQRSPALKEQTQQNNRRKEMLDILQLVERLNQYKMENLQSLSQEQLLQLIKGRLLAIVPTQKTKENEGI